MKRILTILLLITSTASAQMPIRINCAGASPQMIGAPGALGSSIIMVLSCGDLFSKAALNLGPQDPSLNPSYWYTPGRNLLTSSGDMTEAGWSTVGAVVDDATHFSVTVVGDRVQHAQTTIDSASYTLYLHARISSGSASLKFEHVESASGSTSSVSLTGTLDDYAITVLGKSGGGIVYFGLYSASGVAQIEVTRWAVIPGTHTAAEAAAIYEATPVKRNWYDYASGGNDGCFGGNCATATTNDPTPTPYDYNGWGPRSRTDLTHADWTATTATATATTFTPTAQNGGVTISYTGTSGASYLVSAELGSAGNLGLQWTTGATNPAVTVTATPTRYSVAYTGTGAAENIGLRDGNAAGWGAITATDWQIEQVPSGMTTPSVYSAGAATLVVNFDGVDDYAEVPTNMADGSFSILLAAKTDGSDGHTMFSWVSSAAVPSFVFKQFSRSLLYLGLNNYRYWDNPKAGDALFHIIVITLPGTMQTDIESAAMYLDAQGLIASSTVLNGAQASRVTGKFLFGRSSGTFLTGNILPPKIWSRVLSAAEVKTVTCDLAQKMWDEQGIPVWGAQAQCPNLDFTVAPTN